MTDIDNLPCLLYSMPADPDTTQRFPLRAAVTCLGRLTPDQVDPPDADCLQLHGTTVSLRHARIVRTDSGYVLHNWHGRYGIGLYERELQPGESHLLAHCDVFRIPARADHVRLQFVAASDQTHVRPLDIDYDRRAVYVFGVRLTLAPLEYRLLIYLHQRVNQLCLYDDVTAALWGDVNPYERKGNFEVLLDDLRAKLRTASGGFTFVETIRGHGVRLVV